MSWPLEKLGDLVSVKGGKRLPKGEEYSEVQTNHPYIRVCDMGMRNLSSNVGELKYISSETHQKIQRYTISSNDVYISIAGTIGIVGSIPKELDGANLTENAAKLLIKDPKILDQDYLVWYLATHGKASIDNQVKATSQPKLALFRIEELQIPLPPLPEQKRIAAILDKADAIRRKRQQAIQLADEFLRAVFLDMFGDPVSNPKGWEVVALKDISRIQIGPFGTQLHKEDYIHGGIPLINPTHIVKGKIAPKDDLSIRAEKHASLPEYHLDIGDIIMARRGEMGRCAVVAENEKGWLCGTGSLFIRPSKAGVFSEYLSKLLASDAIKSHLESESQGATMPNLNKTIVGNIQVPVPNDEVLNQFAEIREIITHTKSRYLSSAQEMIFESLSQKSFTGNL